MRPTVRGTLLSLVAAALALPAAAGASVARPALPDQAAVPTTAATSASLPGCAPSSHAGGDWTHYGHDLANTRDQPLEKVITPARAATLAPAWSFDAKAAGGTGDFTGTPLVTDGCLYVGSTAGWMFALNADTGAKVWATKLPAGSRILNTPAVSGGQVYLGVSRTKAPYVAALDQATGALLWQTQVDSQEGSEIYGSPLVHDGVLGVGVSGGAAELDDEETRYAFQGSFVLLETQDDPARGRVPGTLMRKTWTVHEPEIEDGFAGATVWSTPALDPATGMAFFGTGNPFQPDKEHEHSNAVVKLDWNRASPTFGEIVGSYKGDIDEYLPVDAPCADIPGNPPPYYPQGVGGCMQLDLDFGSSSNLFRGPDGRLLVGTGQKSGVYHVFEADTMEPAWKQIVGAPSAVGGIVGSTAVDADGVHGPVTVGGYLWSIDRGAGQHRWAMPLGDGAHWGNPVSTANGVVYTTTLTGTLNAYDAKTGAPLLSTPMLTSTGSDAPASWAGVAVARNTVYATVGLSALSNGYVIAYRPDMSLPLPEGPPSLPAPPAPLPGGGSDLQAVSGPQAQFYGYLTPAVVAPEGAEVTYTNIDLVKHDLVQDPRVDGVAGDGSAPWCDRFQAGQCPLFFTELMGLAESTQVQGIDTLPSGVYSFYCTLHPGMKGKLVRP